VSGNAKRPVTGRQETLPDVDTRGMGVAR